MIIFNILFIVGAFLILFWQVSLIIAVLGGAPTVYAKNKDIRKAFGSAGLKKGQSVADLGCGNARSLIIATKQFGAKGIGIEISPFYYLLARINVVFRGQSKNIKIYFGNFKNHLGLIKNADVIFLYLFEKIIFEIEPEIYKTKKPDASIVSLAFPIKNHEAVKIKTIPPIFIYQIEKSP